MRGPAPARRPTFFACPKKVGKERTPHGAAPVGVPCASRPKRGSPDGTSCPDGRRRASMRAPYGACSALGCDARRLRGDPLTPDGVPMGGRLVHNECCRCRLATAHRAVQAKGLFVFAFLA